jgi:UDPglucose--hexose-1-phosphate uridylyltransferase
MMGCSNPHPHGQIWAETSIPTEPAKEQKQMKAYVQTHQRSLLSDYIMLELDIGKRIVCENDDFVVLVPFWAVWPFETLILSKRHFQNLNAMSKDERRSFANILKRITARYDNLFTVSFPYSAGIHQSPTDGATHDEWHFHMHFYPPLLRSATVKKFMVGYEMLANPQRDITPELSAERLRALPEIHFKKKQS